MNIAALLATWAIPGFLLTTLIAAVIRKVDLFDAFVEGASDGLRLIWKIAPFVLAIYVAVGVFRTSGLMSGVGNALSPFLAWLGIPVPILPLALIRPLSGSAATGLFLEILHADGPDSHIGRLASIMQGSSETTFYVLTVYLGSVGIRNARYAVAVCLLADIAGFLASALVTSWYFGN